ATMRNGKALASGLYKRLTPDERYRLLLSTGTRGDEAEQARLRAAAGRIELSVTDYWPFAVAASGLSQAVFFHLVEAPTPLPRLPPRPRWPAGRRPREAGPGLRGRGFPPEDAVAGVVPVLPADRPHPRTSLVAPAGLRPPPANARRGGMGLVHSRGHAGMGE